MNGGATIVGRVKKKQSGPPSIVMPITVEGELSACYKK